MIKVCVTGVAGSGKSHLCRRLADEGASVLYMDDLAKCCAHDDDIKEQIITEFGELSYKEGVYNTSYIANIVFGNEAKLALLNAIFAPRIDELVEKFFNSCADDDIVFVEAALVYEHDKQDMFDFIINVTARQFDIFNRLLERNWTSERIAFIQRVQFDQVERIRMADLSIESHFNVDDLIDNIRERFE